MASIISAGTTSGTALNLSGDTSGTLQLQTQAGANTITVPNATGTIFTTADVATQANQETATSTTTLVTSGRQQFHPSAAKAWLDCGVAADINASYNVTGLTDNGPGDLTVTWTTAFSSANYARLCTVRVTAGTVSIVTERDVAKSASSTRFLAVNGSGTGTDPLGYYVCAFGDQ